MSSVPLVSIVCVTYQHASFIGEALDGFLAQKVNFAYEIIVHDDASTDGTAEIVQEYAANDPEKFKVIRQTVNQRSKGIRPWPPCFAQARGKYIALCEGDDHWFDPLKLQRQVDAMEADPEATGCFTNAYNVTDGVRQVFLGHYNSVPKGLVLEQEEYLRGQGIPTCTFLFRRELIQTYNEVVLPFATGDTALFTLLTGMGHLIYQPVFTSVRLIHPGGVYSMKGPVHHLRVQLQNLPEQDKLSAYRHHEVIQLRKEYALKKSWREAMEKQNWELARLVWKHVVRDRSVLGWSMRETLLAGLRVQFPVRYERTLGSLHRLRRAFTRSE